MAGGDGDLRQVRRVLTTTSSYLQRWQRRATPFGLFAGVARALALYCADCVCQAAEWVAPAGSGPVS